MKCLLNLKNILVVSLSIKLLWSLHQYQQVVLLSFDHASADVEGLFTAFDRLQAHDAFAERRDDWRVVFKYLEFAACAGQLHQPCLAVEEDAVWFCDFYFHKGYWLLVIGYGAEAAFLGRIR